jgi:hypothetical protein
VPEEETIQRNPLVIAILVYETYEHELYKLYTSIYSDWQGTYYYIIANQVKALTVSEQLG